MEEKEESTSHWVLAYYIYTQITDPHEEVRLHKEFLKDKDFTCRIYISEEGINGQSCGTIEAAKAYMDWMHSRIEFADLRFKIHLHHEQAFPRQTIKYRKQLVAIDASVDMENGGEHVSPKEWKEMLEKEDKKILIDVRNDYEWKVGRFEGAELPPCETFREFVDYAEKLKESNDPKKTPVMMYCTGGIRCEVYSAILKDKGFENVYQLNGGIIGYGLEQGNDHWQGKLFVFDDRLTVPISEKGEEPPVIGTCHHCENSTEAYYNCANMDCNKLFLCCPDCIKEYQGCCCQECSQAARVRPYQEVNAHKPFRRWYNYDGIKKKQAAS